jgi:hypothetical protein
MKTTYLLTTAAAALLITGAASAQTMNPAPQRAPAAQQNAPAEKVAPSMHAGEHKSPASTTGQATHEDQASPRAGMKANERNEHSERSKPGTTGQGASSSSMQNKNDKTEMKGDSKTNKTEMRDERGEKGNATKGETRSENRNGGSATERSTQSDAHSKTSTTGQGAAGAAAHMSTEQRTKIVNVFHEHHVAPAHLNVSIRVGTRVPSSVHFYPVPTQVVTVYPEWRGYDYILVGDQILILDPGTHEIVAILDA